MEDYLIFILTLIMVITPTKEEVDSTRRRSFDFAVLADPQPHRLQHCYDLDGHCLTCPPKIQFPWDNKVEWLKRSLNVVTILNFLDPDFAIINGDMTEYGKTKQWQSAVLLYGYCSSVPAYYGLGNHDYENNVQDCWDLWNGLFDQGYDYFDNEYRQFSIFTGPDGCAIGSVENMDLFLDAYKERLHKIPGTHFRAHRTPRHLGGILDKLLGLGEFIVDSTSLPRIGSFSYSWDWKGVHFVQLQNYPSYSVQLKKLYLILILPINATTYIVTDSLTWLREDLRLARQRGIKDIIINFHQTEGLANSDIHDQKHFRAIMDTYKPLAIFAGHWHRFLEPEKNTDKDLFGDNPLYITSAAFCQEFHSVEYDDGRLIIKYISAKGGKKEVLKVLEQNRIDHKSNCFQGYNFKAPRGSFFSSLFLPEEGTYWNIFNERESQGYLASNNHGTVYMTLFDSKDQNAKWSFVKIVRNDFDEEPEFGADHQIKNLATDRVLACDEDGNLYTTKTHESNFGHEFPTYWRITKTQNTEFILIHSATDLVLVPYNNSKYDVPTIKGMPLLVGKVLSDFSWQIKHPETGEIRENVRYFKALSGKSGSFPLPTTNQSNKYWEFAGYHDYLKASPCVGW